MDNIHSQFLSEAIYEEMCQSCGLFRAPPLQIPHSFGKYEEYPKKKTAYELVRQYILNIFVCFLPCTFDLPPHTQTGKKSNAYAKFLMDGLPNLRLSDSLKIFKL